MLTVHLEHDPDLECPADMDCQWTLYSFCQRHNSFKHPDELNIICNRNELVRVLDRKLKTKLKNGLAHVLSYFEHGQSWWGRKDESIPAGVEFQWDGVRVAGLLVWEHNWREIGGKTFDDRATDADLFLKRYNGWANGEGYCYRIEDEDGDDVDSCNGYDDSDYMLGEIVPHLLGKDFEVEGDAKYLERTLNKLIAEKHVGQPVS